MRRARTLQRLKERAAYETRKKQTQDEITKYRDQIAKARTVKKSPIKTKSAYIKRKTTKKRIVYVKRKPSKTAKYVAYNRLYFKGKPTGQAYRVEEGTNKEALLKKVNKYNNAWNKSQKKGGYSAKIIYIKGVKVYGSKAPLRRKKVIRRSVKRKSGAFKPKIVGGWYKW